MVKATINNNFHNTTKDIRLNSGKNEIRGRRLADWERALCCSDCICSGIGGLRGDLYNPAIQDADGNALEWYEEYDRNGTAYLVVWA